MSTCTARFPNELPSPAPAVRPKAYSYVRFSTKRQGKGDSLMRQLDKSRQYAAEHGLDLQEATFEDLGISAFDGSNIKRGALAAFIKAVEAGTIERGSVLLVESLDRLSRAEAVDAMSLLTTLVKLGIRVVTVIDGRVLDEKSVKDPMNLIWATLVFVRANEESETKSDRVKKAHRRKRDERSTFAFGQGPGWLRPTAGRDGWEPIPEKAESVRKVFEYTAKGYGATAIARIANREGWPVPARSDSWHKTLPHKLVCNRRVLGEFEPQTSDGKDRKPTGELWPDYYPPIIPLDLFNQANAAIARRRHLPKRRDDGYHNVFQGMLRCGHCGATLARKAKNGKKNSVGYALYVCADRDRGLTQCPNWNARQLEDALIPPLVQFVAADVLEGTVRQQTRAELESERVMLDQEQKAAANLTAAVERMGGSPIIEARLIELGKSIGTRPKRIAELATQAADPMASVWAEDVDLAICDALRAVRDVTAELAEEREALHQSLLRVVREVCVWPGSHAVAQLHGDSTSVMLPLSTELPGMASAAGGLRFSRVEGVRLAA